MARTHPWSLRYLRLWLVTKFFRLVTRVQLWRAPLPPFHNPQVIRTERNIPSRDQGRSIRTRWYRPASASPDEALPVLINFHGSGFILPMMLGQEEPFLHIVAERARCLVIDADYRKAPENPFPLPCEDVEDVALYVLAQVPHTTMSFSGWSAGGNLALGLAVLLGPERVRSLLLFYPSTAAKEDRDGIPPETRMDSGSPMPPGVLRHFVDCYILPETPLDDLRLSPGYAPTESMPRHIWAVAGTADPLYTPCSTMMKRLQREGHPDAVFRSLPFAGHGFVRSMEPGGTPDPRTDEVYTEAIEFLCKSIAT
ncbi:Alpha/Beta hydrolase protein [Roridomyces roridus]|uniref:Alpha/Beta hydrolase protein n=1 Tax=Roridomyces roridus TaxID=1738132 RepID=A0AAD7FR89_9AGAR|nr:Alpha/Beta hydrolase protein [Roridomyces roridus]